MTTNKQWLQAVIGTGLVVVTLGGCLSNNQASSGAAALTLSSSDGGSGSAPRNVSSSGSSGVGSLSTGSGGSNICQISSGVGSVESGIKINPNSTCLITKQNEGGTRNPGNGFGTGSWTPPDPSIHCASPSPQTLRAGLSTQAIIAMRDIDFAGTGLFITSQVTNAEGQEVVPSAAGSFVAAISAGGVVIDYSSAANLSGLFDVAFSATAGGQSGTCVVRVDNRPDFATPPPDPRADPQLACNMGSVVPALSANGEVTVRFGTTRGQLEPTDVVGFRVRDDASNADLSADPGVSVPADAAFGSTGTTLSVAATGPRRIPFAKAGRLFAVVNGVEQANGCAISLVPSQCVGTSCGPIPNNACGAGIDNYIVSSVDATTPIQIATDLDPQGLASNLSLLSGNFVLAKASLLNVGIGAYEFKILAATDLPTVESKVRLTFSRGSSLRFCDILVPKIDSLGGSDGNGTGDGGTYQGIVGNVFRTPTWASRLMKPMELPNPMRDNLLWSHFARTNWSWTNGLPGVSAAGDGDNLKEWVQVNFGSVPLAFAKYRGYDLNHIVRTEFTVPYEGKLTVRSASDDGALVFVDQNGPSEVPLTSEGLPDVDALNDLSNTEIQTALVNNDGLHPMRIRDGFLYVGAARFASQCNGVAGLVYSGTGASQRLVHQCLATAGVYAFRLYYYQGPRTYIGNLLKWSYDSIVVNDQLVACSSAEAQALMASTGIQVPCGSAAFGAQNSSNALIPPSMFKSLKGSSSLPATVQF